MRQLGEYWPFILVVLAGLVIVGAMTFTSATSGQMLWVGGFIGLLAGAVIAVIQQREERRDKRRKR